MRTDPEPRSWRWTTLDVLAGSADASLESGLNVETVTHHERPLIGAPFGWDEAGPRAVDDIRARFRFPEDVSRWRATLGEAFGLPASGEVPGVLWTHTPGGPAPGSLPSDWDRTLASHLFSGELRPELRLTAPPGCGAGAIPLVGSDRLFPGIGGRGTWPWLTFASIACREGNLGLALIRFDRDLWAIPPDFGITPEEAQTFTGHDGPFVAPAETGVFLPRDGLRFVAVDAALRLVRAVDETEFGLVDRLSGCAPGQCGALVGPAARTASAASAPSTASIVPTERSDASLVLSATRRELFAVGGLSPAGVPRGDVWSLDVDLGTWRALELPTRLGWVLAATYDASSGDLLVLDETRGPGRRDRHVRLVRLDADGGALEIVGSWRRIAPTDRFAMATSAGGDLFVAASGPGAVHAIAWLEPAEHGTFELRGMAFGVGRLVAGQMRVDGSGVSVLLEDRRTGSYPRGYEQRAFTRISRWADRCF